MGEEQGAEVRHEAARPDAAAVKEREHYHVRLGPVVEHIEWRAATEKEMAMGGETGSARVIEVGTQEHTKVLCLDGPGAGGACHEYEVVEADPEGSADSAMRKTRVSFQNGPIKENGVNGCHQEDLLVIVLDRLQHFQAGDYRCRENALAITKLEEALHWLRHRTNERQARGVEGTSEK